MGIETLFLNENGEYFSQFSRNKPTPLSADEGQLLVHPIGGLYNSFNKDDLEIKTFSHVETQIVIY